MVYSTNPDFTPEEPQDEDLSISPSAQDLRVWREVRKGKSTTIIRGFRGSDSELRELGKELRKKCSCGGSDKDGEIILQGDVRDKVMNSLQASGYKCKKAGG